MFQKCRERLYWEERVKEGEFGKLQGDFHWKIYLFLLHEVVTFGVFNSSIQPWAASRWGKYIHLSSAQPRMRWSLLALWAMLRMRQYPPRPASYPSHNRNTQQRLSGNSWPGSSTAFPQPRPSVFGIWESHWSLLCPFAQSSQTLMEEEKTQAVGSTLPQPFNAVFSLALRVCIAPVMMFLDRGCWCV